MTIIQVPGTRTLDMKHPAKQKYLHDYPRLQPSATDGDIDIKQVLRTIKQLRETKMIPINVGVPRLVNMSWSYKAIQQVQAGASGGRGQGEYSHTVLV